MLLLANTDARSRSMLTAVTLAAVMGCALAAAQRSWLGMTVDIPLHLAGALAPMLALLWLGHLRGWPLAPWIEGTFYVLMVGVAQLYMEADVTAALFVVPVIGVLYRRRGLTVYVSVLSAPVYAFLIWTGAIGTRAAAPSLQFGAFSVLIGALAMTYWSLITLAERAERSLHQARMSEEIAMQWAVSIEARDAYTGGHTERVTRYALLLAPHVPNLGIDLELFRLGAILHDVGKIAVPDQILNKPGPLTAEEFKIMQSHAASGYDLVMRTHVPPEVADLVRHHHERWDGKGYPDGLRGAESTLAARVLAVADAFDAMTSDRPYRKALSPEHAREQIRAGAGTQFDPAVVAAFEAVYPAWAALVRAR